MERMLVVPVNFQSEHRSMLQHAKQILETINEESEDKEKKIGLLAIPGNNKAGAVGFSREI
jgi:hypothetical protein